MNKTPKRLREAPQTEALPFSTAVEALIVEPWVRHHAAAMILAAIVIAAGMKVSIFTASFCVSAGGE
jgi:mannose-1-phosphate guanylyltransferase